MSHCIAINNNNFSFRSHYIKSKIRVLIGILESHRDIISAFPLPSRMSRVDSLKHLLFEPFELSARSPSVSSQKSTGIISFSFSGQHLLNLLERAKDGNNNNNNNSNNSSNTEKISPSPPLSPSIVPTPVPTPSNASPKLLPEDEDNCYSCSYFISLLLKQAGKFREISWEAILREFEQSVKYNQEWLSDGMKLKISFYPRDNVPEWVSGSRLNSKRFHPTPSQLFSSPSPKISDHKKDLSIKVPRPASPADLATVLIPFVFVLDFFIPCSFFPRNSHNLLK